MQFTLQCVTAMSQCMAIFQHYASILLFKVTFEYHDSVIQSENIIIRLNCNALLQQNALTKH